MIWALGVSALAYASGYVWMASYGGSLRRIDRIGRFLPLFGGGGEPMNATTQKAIDDLLDKLFGK